MDPWAFQRWAFREVTVGNLGRKALLMGLASMADATSGRCEAKVASLAMWAELKERSVQHHLAELEKQGLIARRAQFDYRGRQRGNEYLLLAPWVTEWPDGMPVAGAAEGCTPMRLGVQDTTPLGVQDHAPLELPLGTATKNGHISSGQERGNAQGAGEAPPTPTPCWSEPPASEAWSPTYSCLSPVAMRLLHQYEYVWAEPEPVVTALDLWRDLHWHFDAGLTPVRQRAIVTALRHYDLRMAARAIGGALIDPWIQGTADNGDGSVKYDKLETILAVTDKRDNVERLANQCSEERLEALLEQAEENRRHFERFRAESWERLEEAGEWLVHNRDRLRKDSPGRYNRFTQWRQSQGAMA